MCLRVHATSFQPAEVVLELGVNLWGWEPRAAPWPGWSWDLGP